MVGVYGGGDMIFFSVFDRILFHSWSPKVLFHSSRGYAVYENVSAFGG